MADNNSSSYRSSCQTPVKQSDFRYLIERQLAMIGVIRQKHSWARQSLPIFFDFYSGPGRDIDGSPGSPVILLELAPYPIEAHYYECDRDSVQKLLYNTGEIQNTSAFYVIHPADNMTVADIMPKRTNHDRLGLAYSDPSNGDLAGAFAPLRIVANKYRLVDLVINYAATSWKRQNKLEHYQNLLDLIKTIPKQKWMIREPFSQFHWTMLFGTNYLKYLPDKKRWHDIDSPEGYEWYMKAALTKEQRNIQSQMTLFQDGENQNE